MPNCPCQAHFYLLGHVAGNCIAYCQYRGGTPTHTSLQASRGKQYRYRIRH